MEKEIWHTCKKRYHAEAIVHKLREADVLIGTVIDLISVVILKWTDPAAGLACPSPLATRTDRFRRVFAIRESRIANCMVS